MDLITATNDSLYLLMNGLSGRSRLFDVLAAVPMQNNLVKAGPVAAALIFAWFSGGPDDKIRRRCTLMLAVFSLAIILPLTKTLGPTVFAPRPIVRTMPILQLSGETLVAAKQLPFREPLAGDTRERFDALRAGNVTANDLASFPSDHAAMFFALALGVFFACRVAGIFALAWTILVILASRVIAGLHSPLDILAGIVIGGAFLSLTLAVGRLRPLRKGLEAISRWTVRQEALAAAFVFLVAHEITTLLAGLESLASTALTLVKAPARALLGALAALLLTGCGLGPNGGLVLLENGWKAEVIATHRTGITSPDGLQWTRQGLLIADEGGSAIRLWRPGQGFVTLVDRRADQARPEDVVGDGRGNVYFTDDDVGGLWRTSLSGEEAQPVTRPGLLGPTEGLALHPSGRLLVGDADHHRVISVGTAGDIRTVIPPSAGITKPESLALAPDGTLFIADNEADTLFLLTTDGRLHRPVSGLENFSPESIFHSGEALFITDSMNGKLYRYTSEEGLKPIVVFGGDLAKVQGIAGDERGNLYVSVQTTMHGGRGFLVKLSPA